MDDKNIVFAYTGTFNHVVTTALLKEIKRKLGILDDTKGIDKKLYKLLVECIENMSRHSYHKKEESSGIFLLSKSDGKYMIITGNNILNKDIPELKAKLKKVSELNLEGLKNMYREQILVARTSENNAGLGIIDIAIKSGNKIKYDFLPHSDLISFYLFQTEINII
jgi:hypothetical protein